MSNLIKQLVEEYLDFSVEKKKVQIPYSIALPMVGRPHPYVTRTTRFKHFAAKGTPQQIKQTLYQTAQEKHFDLKQASSQEIHEFMLQEGIGVDCSGFVYQVLDAYLRLIGKGPLRWYMYRQPGWMGWLEHKLCQFNRVRRTSAATLTNTLNTIEIKKVRDIQPGDMIRLTDPHWIGKHIALIVEKTPQKIIYAHSSESTANMGPHLAEIEIVNPELGLEKQRWTEKKMDGTSYFPGRYVPENGDSVRRLKCLVSDSKLGL